MSLIAYQKGTSFWLHSSTDPGYAPLAGDLEVDVVVIGGGIAGLSCAYLLKRAGCRVAVLEESVVGGGTTGYTTGKVTSQHNRIYATLAEQHGQETARLYGEANQRALEDIRRIVAEEAIACDWRDEDNYVFTENPEEVDALKREAQIAASLGLPASFVTETPLPFAVGGAVRFANQGTFHARKYALGLAALVHGDGSYVFEQTKAGDIDDGSPVTVETPHGTVRAAHAIIATLVPYPVTAHTAYALIEYPLTSYIVAVRSEHDLPGMYITSESPTYSILPVRVEGESLTLVGGLSHIPGSGRAASHYERLIEYAREKLGGAPTEYRWQAWDYLGYDQMPAIGKLYPWSTHVFTATGFMKWGLTTSMVAAMILRDRITGNDNPWAGVFDSTRGSTVASIPRFLTELPKLVG